MDLHKLVPLAAFASLALGWGSGGADAPSPAVEQLIVVDELVVGMATDGTWRDPGFTPPGLTYPATFHLIGLGEKAGTKQVAKIFYFDGASEGLLAEIVGDEPGDVTREALALAEPTYPRLATRVSNDSTVYTTAVRRYLASKGLNNASVVLKRVIRVDLNGNGREEVLIEAISRAEADETFGEPRDYSAVLLRYVDSKGRVQTVNYGLSIVRVEHDLFETHKLGGIADLDGDGLYEVVISSRYYEGNSGEVRRFEKDTTRILCGWGVGA